MYAPIIIICIGWAAAICLLAFALGQWLKIRTREVKSKESCPVTGKALTSHEAFYGHCFSCPFRNTTKCRLKNAHVTR